MSEKRMFCINWPKCLLKLHLRAFSFSQSSKFLAICSFNEALDLSVKGVTKLPKLQSLDKKNLLKFVVIVQGVPTFLGQTFCQMSLEPCTFEKF